MFHSPIEYCGHFQFMN
uniref:Uncharacterized protein n=1 Tax=Anguilla anguilla TaxID=7936 RepID=A0A0E9T9Y3_ANGAN